MRSVIAALVVALVLVPALARTQQTLDPGRTPTAGFSKSVDVPPDTVSVLPDRSVTLIDIDAVFHPAERVVVNDDRLPEAPDPGDHDLLRGPPASV